MYALQTPFPTIKSLVRLYASYLTFAQHKHQTAKEVEYDKFKGRTNGGCRVPVSTVLLIFGTQHTYIRNAS